MSSFKLTDIGIQKKYKSTVFEIQISVQFEDISKERIELR